MSDFNLDEGERRKLRGMSAAAQKRYKLLKECRAALAEIASNRESREATADDASRWTEANKKPSLGNASGSLFKGGDWEFTGKFVKSSKVTNHASDLRVWRLK